MKQFCLLLCTGWLSVAAVGQETRIESTIYFPGDDDWETVSAASLNLNADALNKAIDFAMERNSSSVVVLLGGKIIAERHQPLESPTLRYRAMIHGSTDNGQVIEDVASVQKSVVSMLMGIAIENGLVKLGDRVDKHLGQGWSQATPEQEANVTLRHLVTMSSGLTDQLKFKAPAGTKWAYNTTAYSRSFDAIVAAAGKTHNEVTREWLTEPLGMKDSKWTERRNTDRSEVPANRFGFATTARDLARFGLMVMANGQWNGSTVVSDQDYIKAATSPSQKMNPSYGYLWWLNGQKSTIRGNRRAKGPLIPGAPRDLFAAQGALGRKCYVVPSRQIVVTRLGDDPEIKGKPKFNQEFWRLLKRAGNPR